MVVRTERYTFFFRPEAPFSQWHPARFDLDGHGFVCAEQYMMYGKTVLFGDAEVGAEMLEATSPKQHKALGRKVRGFSGAVWEANRERIVMAGSRGKFTQNPARQEALLATAGTELVEASPF